MFFEKLNQEASVFIGSSNLTAGGLYTNYEATYSKRFNLLEEDENGEYGAIKEMINSYKDTNSPCCKLVTDDLLRELYEFGYVANEEVLQGIFAEAAGSSASPARARLFGSERFPPPPVRIVREAEQTPRNEVTGIIGVDTGFWKKLSHFDVSTTSAPGQIIIPIRFLNLFPVFSEWEITPSNARQADVFFNIIFIDGAGVRTRLNNVRAIHYIPAPNHPRPNQELRFTFRERQIFSLLEEGDILEFKKTNSLDVWFIVRIIKAATTENRSLSRQGKYGTIT